MISSQVVRTLVDIPQEWITLLDRETAVEKVSRAELIRRAISGFLETRRKKKNIHAFFGIWKSRKTDGVAYQRKLRSEWDRK